jgi:hypothetical protein
MDLFKEKSIKALIEGNSDFRGISPENRQEGIRQRASFKLTQLLGDRKVNELSLEEALKLKELGDLTVNWKGEYDRTTSALYDHIDSLYEIEAAGEFVKALKLAYKRRDKLSGDIQELESVLTESAQQLYREREAARFRLEEGMKMILEELNHKKEEKRILEEEIPKLQLQIKKLKEEYLSSDLPKQMKQVAHEALRSELAAEAAARRQQAAETAAVEKAQKTAAWDAHFAQMKQQMEREAGEPSAALQLAARGNLEAVSASAPSRKNTSNRDRGRRGESRRLLAAKVVRGVSGIGYLHAKRAKNRAENALKNAAEQKAVRNLNARESERAANLIFPSQNRQNQTRRKQTWGIPNVGPGFGGSRKRRRSRKN